MWHFVVTMWPEAGFEEFVGQDSSLWEAIDSFTYFNINIAIEGMGIEIILVNYVLGKGTEWDLHVFISGHWCPEVEVLDVDAEVFGSGRAYGAVPKDFCGREVCCARGELPWVIDQISTGCEADTVWV